jgi:hypothetical protein
MINFTRPGAIAAMIAVASFISRSPAAAPPAISLIRVPDGGIQPQAISDENGTVHLLYFKGEAAHGDLFYARLISTGTFSVPVRVNTNAASAIATGTMRGGHIAIGRDGRIHVAWHGSDRATPKAPGDETPVLYSRSDKRGLSFEPERNVVQRSMTGLDAGGVAADRFGNVYVAWHAFEPGLRGEADRRVWITRSHDDGTSFDREVASSAQPTGVCGCCSVGIAADRRGTLYSLYRAATDTIHRDTYLLVSRDRALTFSGQKLEEWNINACPMSSFSFADGANGMLAAWETAGQVQWTQIEPSTGKPSRIIAPAGGAGDRKHPAIAVNRSGDVLFVWTEGTGWNKGGRLSWQLYDAAGTALGAQGHADGVPVWDLAAAVPRTDGSFAIVY